jgi:hypothetical protein
MHPQVDGKTTLSESDHQELARIRRILCLPNEVARQAQKDTAGRVLEEAIRCVKGCVGGQGLGGGSSGQLFQESSVC